MGHKISFLEIENVVKNLKNKKAVAFYIDIGPFVQIKLFNYIFDSGNYPAEWSRGLIKTLYKKGSAVLPGNYRGITICSCL